MMVMNRIQKQTTVATGFEPDRRLKGPRLKFRGQMRPMAMGIPYEMYRPLVAIEVVPLRATSEPREGRARRKEQVAPKATVRMGEWKPRSMR